MIVTNYTEARANLKALMDRVVDDCDHAIITRQGGEPVVMLALADWQAMEATTHLLSTPANRDDLLASIAELDAGKGQERELIQP